MDERFIRVKEAFIRRANDGWDKSSSLQIDFKVFDQVAKGFSLNMGLVNDCVSYKNALARVNTNASLEDSDSLMSKEDTSLVERNGNVDFSVNNRGRSFKILISVNDDQFESLKRIVDAPVDYGDRVDSDHQPCFYDAFFSLAHKLKGPTCMLHDELVIMPSVSCCFLEREVDLSYEKQMGGNRLALPLIKYMEHSDKNKNVLDRCDDGFLSSNEVEVGNWKHCAFWDNVLDNFISDLLGPINNGYLGQYPSEYLHDRLGNEDFISQVDAQSTIPAKNGQYLEGNLMMDFFHFWAYSMCCF
ncbi:hypothetical protein REPUB_Repub13aG0067400 [Reevesia pubescens]